jgi:hypothetical protein
LVDDLLDFTHHRSGDPDARRDSRFWRRRGGWFRIRWRYRALNHDDDGAFNHDDDRAPNHDDDRAANDNDHNSFKFGRVRGTHHGWRVA